MATGVAQRRPQQGNRRGRRNNQEHQNNQQRERREPRQFSDQELTEHERTVNYILDTMQARQDEMRNLQGNPALKHALGYETNRSKAILDQAQLAKKKLEKDIIPLARNPERLQEAIRRLDQATAELEQGLSELRKPAVESKKEGKATAEAQQKTFETSIPKNESAKKRRMNKALEGTLRLTGAAVYSISRMTYRATTLTFSSLLAGVGAKTFIDFEQKLFDQAQENNWKAFWKLLDKPLQDLDPSFHEDFSKSWDAKKQLMQSIVEGLEKTPRGKSAYLKKHLEALSVPSATDSMVDNLTAASESRRSAFKETYDQRYIPSESAMKARINELAIRRSELMADLKEAKEAGGIQRVKDIEKEMDKVQHELDKYKALKEVYRYEKTLHKVATVHTNERIIIKALDNLQKAHQKFEGATSEQKAAAQEIIDRAAAEVQRVLALTESAYSPTGEIRSTLARAQRRAGQPFRVLSHSRNYESMMNDDFGATMKDQIRRLCMRDNDTGSIPDDPVLRELNRELLGLIEVQGRPDHSPQTKTEIVNEADSILLAFDNQLTQFMLANNRESRIAMPTTQEYVSGITLQPFQYYIDNQGAFETDVQVVLMELMMDFGVSHDDREFSEVEFMISQAQLLSRKMRHHNERYDPKKGYEEVIGQLKKFIEKQEALTDKRSWEITNFSDYEQDLAFESPTQFQAVIAERLFNFHRMDNDEGRIPKSSQLELTRTLITRQMNVLLDEDSTHRDKENALADLNAQMNVYREKMRQHLETVGKESRSSGPSSQLREYAVDLKDFHHYLDNPEEFANDMIVTIEALADMFGIDPDSSDSKALREIIGSVEHFMLFVTKPDLLDPKQSYDALLVRLQQFIDEHSWISFKALDQLKQTEMQYLSSVELSYLLQQDVEGFQRVLDDKMQAIVDEQFSSLTQVQLTQATLRFAEDLQRRGNILLVNQENLTDTQLLPEFLKLDKDLSVFETLCSTDALEATGSTDRLKVAIYSSNEQAARNAYDQPLINVSLSASAQMILDEQNRVIERLGAPENYSGTRGTLTKNRDFRELQRLKELFGSRLIEDHRSESFRHMDRIIQEVLPLKLENAPNTVELTRLQTEVSQADHKWNETNKRRYFTLVEAIALSLRDNPTIPVPIHERITRSLANLAEHMGMDVSQDVADAAYVQSTFFKESRDLGAIPQLEIEGYLVDSTELITDSTILIEYLSATYGVPNSPHYENIRTLVDQFIDLSNNESIIRDIGMDHQDGAPIQIRVAPKTESERLSLRKLTVRNINKAIQSFIREQRAMIDLTGVATSEDETLGASGGGILKRPRREDLDRASYSLDGTPPDADAPTPIVETISLQEYEQESKLANESQTRLTTIANKWINDLQSLVNISPENKREAKQAIIELRQEKIKLIEGLIDQAASATEDEYNELKTRADAMIKDFEDTIPSLVEEFADPDSQLPDFEEDDE